jgi:hypothetical protein
LSAASRAERGRIVSGEGRMAHGCDRRSAQPIRFGVRERGYAPKVEFDCTSERGQGDSHRLGRYWAAALVGGAHPGRRHSLGRAAGHRPLPPRPHRSVRHVRPGTFMGEPAPRTGTCGPGRGGPRFLCSSWWTRASALSREQSGRHVAGRISPAARSEGAHAHPVSQTARPER